MDDLGQADWLKEFEKERDADCLMFKMNIPEFKHVPIEIIKKLYSQYSHETACAGWLSIDYRDPKGTVIEFRDWATKSPLRVAMEEQAEDESSA